MPGTQPLANRPNVIVRAEKQDGDTKPHRLPKNQLGLQTNSARISKSTNPKYGSNSSAASFLRADSTSTVVPGNSHALTPEQQGLIAKRAELAAIAATDGDTVLDAGGILGDSSTPASGPGALEHTSSLGPPGTAQQSTWTAANGCKPAVWLRVDRYSKLTRADNSWVASTPELVFKVVVYVPKDVEPDAGKKSGAANKAKNRTPAASTGKRAAKTTGAKTTKPKTTGTKTTGATETKTTKTKATRTKAAGTKATGAQGKIGKA